MLPVEALEAWARICDHTDIKWYLFKETLLCAHGYAAFPAELRYAQIVVFAKDLPEIIEYIVPALPKAWVLDKRKFCTGKGEVCFRQNGDIVLMMYVLFGVKDAENPSEIMDEISKIRGKTEKKLGLRKVINKLSGLRLEKPYSRASERICKKAFPKLISVIRREPKQAQFYVHSLKTKSVFEKLQFEQAGTVECGGRTYPVYSGYREYLADVYGDYENGLTDAMGVGLDVNEKEELRKHQARCKEALAFLQGLGREFDLRYYLLAGSVLGPVRDGGLIPWDDDVDVGIRVEELDRFEAVVKEELPKRLPQGFTLEQPGANHPYPRMFSKICFEGRCCIDLWPLIPTYMEGMRARFTWYFGKIITKVHYLKIGHSVGRFGKIAKLMGLFMTDKMVMKAAHRNERRYVGRNTPAYINLYSIYKRNKETIRREWLDMPATTVFDGLEVPVVGNTKLYLTHLYGNYMERPAPWMRASRHAARFGIYAQTEKK